MSAVPTGSITNSYAHYVCGDADGSWYESGHWERHWSDVHACPCYFNTETGEMVWTLSAGGKEVRHGSTSWLLPADADDVDSTGIVSKEQPWNWEQHWSERFGKAVYYKADTKDLVFGPDDQGPPALADVAREIFGAAEGADLPASGADTASQAKEESVDGSADSDECLAAEALAKEALLEMELIKELLAREAKEAEDTMSLPDDVIRSLPSPTRARSGSRRAALAADLAVDDEPRVGEKGLEAAVAAAVLASPVAVATEAELASEARAQVPEQPEPTASSQQQEAAAAQREAAARQGPQPWPLPPRRTPRFEERVVIVAAPAVASVHDLATVGTSQAGTTEKPAAAKMAAKSTSVDVEVAADGPAAAAKAGPELAAAPSRPKRGSFRWPARKFRAAAPAAEAAPEAEASAAAEVSPAAEAAQAAGIANSAPAAPAAAPSAAPSAAPGLAAPSTAPSAAPALTTAAPSAAPSAALAVAAPSAAPSTASAAAIVVAAPAPEQEEEDEIDEEEEERRLIEELEQQARETAFLEETIASLAEQGWGWKARVESAMQDMDDLRQQHSAELAELWEDVRRLGDENAELKRCRAVQEKKEAKEQIISQVPRPLGARRRRPRLSCPEPLRRGDGASMKDVDGGASEPEPEAGSRECAVVADASASLFAADWLAGDEPEGGLQSWSFTPRHAWAWSSAGML